MSNVLVSIITPLYNSAPFIADTIRSVQDQTLNDWEMVIVDDCSTDGSVAVVESFAKKDDRIKLIKLKQNSGPAVARNTAIEAANGRYLAFLDSDDLWLPEKLEKQLAFMQRHKYALTYTYYEKLHESGERTGQIVKPPDRLSYLDMLKSNQIGCLTAMYDTYLLSKIYMPLIRKRQDYGLWLAILKKVPFAYCLPESLALYRVRKSSLSSNKVEMVKFHWLPVPYSNNMGFKERIGAFFRFAWGAARKAASLPADVVFATSTPLTIALPGAYAARRQKVPMVFEVRDLWPELPIAVGALRNPVLQVAARKLERFAYKRSERIVALSPGMKDGVVRTGYPAENVAVIPNSSDLDLFDPGRADSHIFLKDRFEFYINLLAA